MIEPQFPVREKSDTTESKVNISHVSGVVLAVNSLDSYLLYSHMGSCRHYTASQLGNLQAD